MLNRMNDDEKEHWRKRLGASRYDYALTITKRNCDSEGHIWLASEELLKNILKRDPTAYGFLSISTDWGRHKHGHGSLRTKLSQHEVRHCAKSCRVHTKRITRESGWTNYVLKQAAKDCVQTTEGIRGRAAEGGL